jgi:putative ATPase
VFDTADWEGKDHPSQRVDLPGVGRSVTGGESYRPTGHGAERDIGARLERLRAIIRRKRG